MGKNYYNTLDIAKEATEQEINTAYQKLALDCQPIQYHPDENQDSNAGEKFKEIPEAHEVLTDTEKRETYDRLGEEGLKRDNGETNADQGEAHHYNCSGDLYKTLAQETQEQMLKRKETIMLLSLKRRAEQEARRAMKESELARIREEAAMKKQLQEHRKLEYKQRREALLEQYRLKKKAAEANERDGTGGLGEKSSTGEASNTNGPRSMKSSQSSHHTSTWTLYTGPKLYAKPTTKTNLTLIQNAILKALEGAANAKILRRMQDTITAHSNTCNHFLILFRNRNQFRGLYQYDDKKDTITKLDGTGPKTINNDDILKYYKFDSPKRQFTEVQTRQLCRTIIAFTIQDHLWSRPPSLITV